jgi:hypothetical protein
MGALMKTPKLAPRGKKNGLCGVAINAKVSASESMCWL